LKLLTGTKRQARGQVIRKFGSRFGIHLAFIYRSALEKALNSDSLILRASRAMAQMLF